jgi:hypothetical protein
MNARMLLATLLGAGILVMGAGVAHGNTLFIDNHSFENPTLADGSYVSNSIPGWSTAVKVGVYNPSTASFTSEAPDGTNAAFLDNTTSSDYANERFDGSLTTLLTIQPGLTIDFTLDIGRRNDAVGVNPGLFRIALQRTASPWQVLDDAFYDLSNQAQDNWTTQTFQLQIPATLPAGVSTGDPLNFFIQNATSGVTSPTAQISVDNIRARIVPEPSTILIWGLSLMGFAAYVRRRRTK